MMPAEASRGSAGQSTPGLLVHVSIEIIASNRSPTLVSAGVLFTILSAPDELVASLDTLS